MITKEAAHMLEASFRAATEKFIAAELKHGWNEKWKTAVESEWRDDLMKHIAKGDPRDVIIYCAIGMHHGWSTSTTLVQR